jgi:hypothetical protein
MKEVKKSQAYHANEKRKIFGFSSEDSERPRINVKTRGIST